MTNTEPNQPQVSTPSTFVDKLKAASKSALGQMKDAAQYAAKTAQKTKITTLTLPSAYRALGRHVCREKAYRDDFPDIWKELGECFAQIKTLKEQAAARPKAEGIGNKVTAAASATKETAQVKVLEHRTAQVLSRLGEAAYGKHGQQAGPEELTRPVAEALSQVAALDAELSTLSKASTGKRFTPKKLAIGGGVCLLLIVMSTWFSLSGLQESGRDKAEATAKAHLASADELWKAGKQNDAVDAYMAIANDTLDTQVFGLPIQSPEFTFLSHSESARLFNRIIESRIAVGGPEAARDYVRKALERDIPLSLNTEQANALLAEERQKLTDEHKEAQRRLDSKDTLPDGSTAETRNATIGQKARAFIKVGMTPANVRSVLGEADSKEPVNLDGIEGSLDGWGYSGNTVIILYAHSGKYKGNVVCLMIDGSPVFVGDKIYKPKSDNEPRQSDDSSLTAFVGTWTAPNGSHLVIEAGGKARQYYLVSGVPPVSMTWRTDSSGAISIGPLPDGDTLAGMMTKPNKMILLSSKTGQCIEFTR